MKNQDNIETYGYAYFCKLLDYFLKKNILISHFKFKDFIKGEEYGCFGGHRPYSDIDLSYGRIRIAFAYGLRYNYIEKVSGSCRKLNLVLLKNEGMV